MKRIRNKEYSYIALKKAKYITYNDITVRMNNAKAINC